MAHLAILQLLSMNASPVKSSQELFVVYRIRGSVYLWRNQYRGYRQRRQMCPWYVKHVRVGQTEGPSYCLILSYCLCCQSYLCTHGTSAAQNATFCLGWGENSSWEPMIVAVRSPWFFSISERTLFDWQQEIYAKPKVENKVCGVWLL